MKVIKVSVCGECPYFERSVNIWCTKVKPGRIIYINTLPDWCPLEDLDGQE